MTRTFFSGRNNDPALARQTTRTFFFPVIIMIVHPPDRWLYLFFPVVIMIAHPPDRQLELFFPVVITIARPPNRRLKLFFSGRNNNCTPARQTTRTFFSGCNNDRALAIGTAQWIMARRLTTDRRLYLFFLVVIDLFFPVIMGTVQLGYRKVLLLINNFCITMAIGMAQRMMARRL